MKKVSWLIVEIIFLLFHFVIYSSARAEVEILGDQAILSGEVDFGIQGVGISGKKDSKFEEYKKSKIYWSQLLANLGVETKNSLFDGEKVAAGAQKSNGYPESVRYIKNPSKELLAQIIGKGNPGETSERFTNQGMSEGFSWERITSPQGEINLPGDCREAIFYFELNPGRARKLAEVIGGWLDPSQQTILDLMGKGKVTLYVNGEPYPPVTLNETKTNVPDINLNQFWNTILIYFEPENPKLNLLWRGRQNRAELEFMFD